MKPNKSGYWEYQGEPCKVTLGEGIFENDGLFFHTFNNQNGTVDESDDIDWGSEIIMEPSIKKSELISEIESRMMDWEDRETQIEKAAYGILYHLLVWVKQK